MFKRILHTHKVPQKEGAEVKSWLSHTLWNYEHTDFVPLTNEGTGKML